MKEYDFSLTFALPADDLDPDVLVERLGACGCDDAIVGIGHKGRIGLQFTRRAGSAYEAVLGAITDVRRAIPDAELVEASPDLVGVSDIAVLLGVSRQNVRKLVVSSKSAGPAPVHEGNPTLWRLAKVLAWLRREKGYTVDDDILALARATMQVNLAVTQRDADSTSQAQILARLA